MPVHRRQTRGVLGTAPQPTVRSLSIPASVGGVNALSALALMPPQDCVWTYNMMPSERGLELRQGYREWATDIGGDGSEEEVRSIVVYDGQQADHSDDRIFAITTIGIYDVTLFNTVNPTAVLTWPVSSTKSGFVAYTNFANDAGEHFVYAADTENGMYSYTASTDTWAAVTGLTVDDGLGVQVPWGLEGDVTYITAHKLRLWMTIDDSGDAFYLPVDSGAGEVFKFTFGSKFKRGGYLIGLWSWSYESSSGIEDYLIAISRAGDLLIYVGSDPTQPDWRLVGGYFIGETTSSRDIAINYGSEMMVLSAYGLTNITDLIKGIPAYEVGASPTTKISRVLRRVVADGIDSKNWGLTVSPATGGIVIHSPYEDGRPQDAIQYVQNILTKAWGYWRGVPILSSGTAEGGLYIGDKTGSVWIMDGSVDKVTLAADPGVPIEFDTLSSFNPGSAPAQYMQVGYIRTVGLLEGQSAVNTAAVYDYKIQNSATSPVPAPSGGGTLWDVGIWDADVWNFQISGSDTVIGALGWGRVVGVSMVGSSDAPIIVTGWDLTVTEGGLI